MPNGPYQNQPTNINPSYPNETFAFCYGTPYGPVTYLQTAMTNGYSDETKSFSETTNPSVTSTGSSADENEITVINESQTDEINESENKPPTTTTSSSSPLSSLNDENSLGKKTINEQQFERKGRDPNSV